MVIKSLMKIWHGGDKPINMFYYNQQHSYQPRDMFDIELTDNEKEKCHMFTWDFSIDSDQKWSDRPQLCFITQYKASNYEKQWPYRKGLSA